MRYSEFRDQLGAALQEAGLFFHGLDRPVETIDLVDTLRRWKVYLYKAVPRNISVNSLRRLHAAGQPIAEMIIDTIGIAALYAFMAHFLLGRETPNSR